MSNEQALKVCNVMTYAARQGMTEIVSMLVEKYFAKDSSKVYKVTVDGQEKTFSENDVHSKIDVCNGKLFNIKVIRVFTGWGLLEAKTWFENNYDAIDYGGGSYKLLRKFV